MRRLFVALVILTPWIAQSMEPQTASGEDESVEASTKQGGKWVRLLEEVLPGEIPIISMTRISQVIAQELLRRKPQIRQYILSHISLPCKNFVDHTDKVTSAALNAAGNKMVTGSHNGTVKIWDTQTGNPTHTLEGHTGWVHSAMFNPTGDKIVTASQDKTAKIWNTQAGTLILTLIGHTECIRSAVFNTTGDKVVTASWDGTVRIWNTQTGGLIRTLDPSQTREVNSALFNQNGDKVVTGSHDRLAKIWDTQTGNLIGTLPGHTECVRSAVFNTTGDNVVTASIDGTAIIWDTANGKSLHRLQGHTGPVYLAEFNPTGDKMVTGSKDRTARIWDTQTGRLIRILRGYTYEVTSAAFNSTGNKMVTTSLETAKIWDLEPLLSCEKFLAEDITHRQVAILLDIFSIIETHHYLTVLTKIAFEKVALLEGLENITFDFNRYPHLWDEYASLPEAIRNIFDPSITKLTLKQDLKRLTCAQEHPAKRKKIESIL